MNVKKNQVSAVLASEPFETVISSGNHQIISDEPVRVGGQDKGPVAHDLLCAALSSCTAITLKMYLMRKQWDLGAIKIDCELTRTIEAGEQRSTITQTISFDHKPDDDQLKRIMIVADKCPVHKTLEKGVDIHTEIK